MMRLVKLHATGNDFLVTTAEVDASTAVLLCDRHRGIGADGVITLGAGSKGAHATMTLRNADGGLAQMSGNGVRCLAWVAARAGLIDGTALIVDTDSGRREVALERDASGDVVSATVDMGAPSFDPKLIPIRAQHPFEIEIGHDSAAFVGDAVGMGNPHLVLPAEDVATVDVATFGPRFEVDERFPERTNIEWITILTRDRIQMRVWERGVGETLSCGTGACAAAVVAHRRELVDEAVTVEVPGGKLDVIVGDTIRLGGPVHHVFNVDVEPDALRTEAADQGALDPRDLSRWVG